MTTLCHVLFKDDGIFITDEFEIFDSNFQRIASVCDYEGDETFDRSKVTSVKIEKLIDSGAFDTECIITFNGSTKVSIFCDQEDLNSATTLMEKTQQHFIFFWLDDNIVKIDNRLYVYIKNENSNLRFT